MTNEAFNFEIQRKIFHLCSLVFPVIYIFFSKITMGIVLTIVAGITLYLDIFRHYNPKIKEFVDNVFGKFQRIEEKSGEFMLSGASYMVFGFLITCLLFSKVLAITSWLVLIVSDCIAAVLGMKFGSPLFNGKSYIGSASFFFSAVLISITPYFVIGYNTSFSVIMVSCLLCTVIEFFSAQINIDDNLSIPLTYALSTFIFGLI